MSYNYHLVAINTDLLRTVCDMPKDTLQKYLMQKAKMQDETDAFWSVVLGRQLYDLGGLSDSIYELIMANTEEVFHSETTKKWLFDYTVRKASRECLCSIINAYQKHKEEYYKEFFNPEVVGNKKISELSWDDIRDDKKKALLTELYKRCSITPVNVETEQKYSVTNSWSYEYAVYNLVHILKMFDWEKDTLLICGW